MTKVLVYADLHYTGITPDAVERLEKILGATGEVDGVICLGDTSWSTPDYQIMSDMWNSQAKPHYMVLGNHDMDRNTKAEVCKFFGMPSNYYSFDIGGIHFCAMDDNFFKENPSDTETYDFDHANYYSKYRGYLSENEYAWLQKDWDSTDKPCVLLSHVSMMWQSDEGSPSGERLNRMISEYNNKVGYKKVFLSINGHNHTDSYDELNGIHYLGVNSASNFWVGEEYEPLKPETQFNEKMHEEFSCLKYTAPYKEAIYAVITFDEAAKTVTVDPCASEYVGDITPEQRGHSGICGGVAASALVVGRQFKW